MSKKSKDVYDEVHSVFDALLLCIKNMTSKEAKIFLSVEDCYKLTQIKDTEFGAILLMAGGLEVVTVNDLFGEENIYTPSDITEKFTLEFFLKASTTTLKNVTVSTTYLVAEGKDQGYVKGTDSVIKIDADKLLFKTLLINNVELSAGTYTLKVLFIDGGSETITLVVAEKIDNPKTIDIIMSSIIFGSISLIGLLGAVFI